MKKSNKSKKILIITGSILLFLALVIGGYFFITNLIFKPDPKNPDNLHPYFSFDASKAPGWFDTMNASTKGMTITEENQFLPYASFTIAEGESSNNPKQNGCFIIYYLFDASTTIEARDKYRHRFDNVPGSGIQMEEVGVVQAFIATPEGLKSFDIHKQHYINNSEPIMEGGATGYVPLASGFIEIQAICRTIEQIEGVVPIVSSVELLP